MFSYVHHFILGNVDAEIMIMCVCVCVCVFSGSLYSGALQHPLPESSCVTSLKHTPESQLPTQPFMSLVGSTQQGSAGEVEQ